MSAITFTNVEDEKKIFKFDAKNTMTYFKDLKEEGVSYVTKMFDSDRDFSLTLLASNLLYKIIMFRRAAIVRDIPGVVYSLFRKSEVDECAKKSDTWFELTTSNILDSDFD